MRCMRFKNKIGFFFVFLTLCLALLAGCAASTGIAGQVTDEEDGKLKIVATIFPAYDFARAVAGEDAQVQMLLKPGEEVHSYEPTPQDIIDIQNCDLFIYTGGENDVWIDDILEDMGDRKPDVIKMLDLVDTYTEETVEGMQEEKGEENAGSGETDSEEEPDEHVWTSPQNAIQIVAAIEEKMAKADPSHSADYEKNAADYEAQIQTVDDQLWDVVNHAKRKTLVFGDRFPLRYFAEEFGLTYYAAFSGCSSDSEPSARTLAFLINKVKEDNIPVVFSIEFSNGNIARAICETTGAEHLTFQTCHNITADQMNAGETYVSLMRQNVKVLKEALQ